MFNQNDIYRALKSGIVTVTFNKVDGSQRVMRCTLADQYLPEDYRGKGVSLTEAENVIRAYDVDSSGWRSFRIDSVTGVVSG